ncbi:recombination regulator RecX [Oxalobacter paraformigenes]|uniref:Regulatory protein RecX n=1 Tax=Oxalobacter paraformigenes TaxID=556268 RepID=C3X6K8_9BURK|nr:recombination regulator RecX [Oxalobacter paraformigenes]EEO28844.1 hypothetical protein OFAG_01997 [Oxalobacter paraformigenes]
MKQKTTLKTRALRYLSIREYSPKELARKLAPHAGSDDDLDTLLQWLQEQGFLSEERFVDTYVRRQSARYGSVRILRELEAYGVDESALRHAQAEMQIDEFERARRVWQKKFGRKPSDMQEKARQIHFLQYRGFSADIIRQVMNRDEES